MKKITSLVIMMLFSTLSLVAQNVDDNRFPSLIFKAGDNLYRYTPDNDTLQLLTEALDNPISCITFSPNSAYMSYIQSDHVYLIDVETGDTTQIIENVSSPCPVWSPDNSRFTYVRRAQLTPDATVYIFDLTTGETIPLDLEITNINQIDWSPDSRHLSFKGSIDIHIYHLETNTLQDITALVDSQIGFSLWSPDGNKLALFGVNEIFIYEVDTSEIIMAMPNNDLWIINGAWSPNNDMILSYVYLDEAFSSSDILLYDLESATFNNITATTDLNVTEVQWSNDGTMVVFGLADPDFDADIYIYDLTQEDFIQVINTPDYIETEIEISSLDSYMAILTIHPIEIDGRLRVRNDIWVYNFDSQTPQNITNTPTITELSASWSPDERWLAYRAVTLEETQSLLIFDVQNNETMQITAWQDTFIAPIGWLP